MSGELKGRENDAMTSWKLAMTMREKEREPQRHGGHRGHQGESSLLSALTGGVSGLRGAAAMGARVVSP